MLRYIRKVHAKIYKKESSLRYIRKVQAQIYKKGPCSDIKERFMLRYIRKVHA